MAGLTEHPVKGLLPMNQMAEMKKHKKRPMRSNSGFAGGKITVWLVFILLIFIEYAQASPTTGIRNIYLPGRFGFQQTQKQNTAKPFKTTDAELADIGKKIMQSNTVASAIFINSLYEDTRLLPPVPTAIPMVLIGLLCISLLRHSRTWVPVLLNLPRGGQAVMLSFSQLIKHLCLKKPNKLSVVVKDANLHRIENNNRLRCDIEGTGYIALLNYLAGLPNTDYFSRLFHRLPGYFYPSPKNKLKISQPAAKKLSLLHSSRFDFCGSSVKCYRRFRPEFAFQTLSRGPPDAAGL